MPPRDWKLWIEDMLQAAGRIERYTASLDFDAFRADELRIDAVIRNLAVIGEAARHIPEDIQNRYPNVPWSEMRGTRNFVTHEYFGVDLGVVWETARSELPPVVLEVRKIPHSEAERLPA